MPRADRVEPVFLGEGLQHTECVECAGNRGWVVLNPGSPEGERSIAVEARVVGDEDATVQTPEQLSRQLGEGRSIGDVGVPMPWIADASSGIGPTGG